MTTTFYASNIAQTAGGLTQSDQMSQTTGGTETSVSVTMPAAGTNLYVELLAQGGTSSGTGALPAPTGKGWSINLAGNTILAGSWHSVFTLAKTGSGITGASLIARWYRRTMDGVYYAIGLSTLNQTLATAKTAYTTPTVTISYPWQFVNGDTLYMDAFVFNASTAWSSDVFTVYVSNSATQGVASDGIIVAPQMITTPAGLSCLIGASSFQTANSGLPVRDQSFTLADALDQRSILTLTGEDSTGTLSYQRGMPVILSDHDQGKLYDGYVSSDKVSKPSAGGVAQLEHMLTMMDHHSDVDKRANTTNYLNWSSGDMVADFIQQTLSQEGITGAFALESDYTPATFGQGTLSGTAATTTTTPFVYAPNTAQPPVTSNTGDLELTRAGTQFALTEQTTSDFASGTLTNMVASGNALTTTTQNALKITAELPQTGAVASTPSTGIHSGGTLYINDEFVQNNVYATFWTGSVSVASNDTLTYDLWIASTSPEIKAGVSLTFNDGTSFANVMAGTPNTNGSSGIYDQNNVSADILTDLTNYAVDTWYTRTIPLTGLSGKTITGVSVFITGSQVGTYTVFVKNCYLGSQAGSPLLSTTATAPQTNPPTITVFGNYLASTVTTNIVAVYNPLTSYRISPAHSIDSVKLVQNSTISWTASLPTGGALAPTYPPGTSTSTTSSSGASTGSQPAVLLLASYDGTTWLSCTNQAALPGLPPGANVAGVSLYLKEQFAAGSDPSALPSLLQVSITINSAATATTSDVTATYGTSANWNTGTFVGLTTDADGDLVLGGQITSPAWTSITASNNQTWYFPTTGFASQSASGGTYTLTSSIPSSSANSATETLFNFAGAATDFTITCHLSINATNSAYGESSILYRTTGWTSLGANYAYSVGIATNGHFFLAYGSNANLSVNVGTATNITFVSKTITQGTSYPIKIVVRGDHHQAYFNNETNPSIDVIDRNFQSAGGFGVYNYGEPSSSSTVVTTHISSFVLTDVAFGTWTSPSINLNALGTCGYNQLCWTETSAIGQPQSTAIVEASLDGGTTWQTCSNGAMIPQLPRGTTVSGKSLLLQVTLLTSKLTTAPMIQGLYLRVCGNYGTVTGTRISPALSLTPVGYVAASNCMWNANIPTNTTLTVQTTQDLSSFHTVGSSGAGEALPYWTAQPAATQDLFSTNTSANYTNANKSGGSTATVTYDTANSRVTLSGGSSGLYLATSAGAMTDMDVLIDMDESDTGGLVWREVSTSNYYELGVYDASSSGGFTNQLRLYKVSSGTRSLLGSASSITFTRGTFHRIRVSMQGGLINVYWDGACVQSYLDTSPLGSGTCGLRNDGGTSRYYQLWIQSLGTNLSGQVLYTKVTMTTTDPSVIPQLFTLVACVRGPSIGTGATIAQLHPVTTPFAAYYSTEMDSAVQASGDYYWYVDKWRQLHFGARLARPGAFPVQSVYDTANASGYLLYQPQVTVLSSADLFRSQQIVTGVTTLVTPPTEIKVADGSTTSWTMGYPLYSAPTITANGQGATVGVQGIDNNRQFYWQPGSTGISYDSTLPKLPAGTVLAFTYVGQSTDNVVLNSSGSQSAQAALELNSGIVAEIESATNNSGKGMTTAQATTFGNGLLTRYGSNSTIEMIGTTLYSGLAPGTVIPLFLPEMLSTWNAQLPIVKLTTTAYQGQNGIIYLYSIDATNGANLTQWQRVFYV